MQSGGLSRLTLRHLASGIGTSPRMLLYDFESRDALLAAILTRLQERQAALVAAELAANPSPAHALERFWAWLTAPEQAPLVRLVIEVRGQIMSGQLDARLTGDWGTPYQAMFERFAAPPEDFTLIRAVVIGLLIEHAHGDAQAADAAMKRFVGVMRTA